MSDQQKALNNEKVLHEQIMPLIKQVHAMCVDNNIPFLAAFSSSAEKTEDDKTRHQVFHMGGSCFLPADESVPPELHLAHSLIFEGLSVAAPYLLKESMRALSGSVRTETQASEVAAAAN